MRKFKFRAYSKSNNKMFDNEVLERAADGLYNIAKSKLLEMEYFALADDLERGIYLPTKDKDLTFMQYTGLNDSNDKEIYEGDIVEFYSNIEDEIITEKVEYHFGIYRAGDYFLGKIYNKCEVIGNIYENPELMEG